MARHRHAGAWPSSPWNKEHQHVKDVVRRAALAGAISVGLSVGVVSAADATMRWSPQAGAKWNSITRSIEAGKKFYKVQPSSVEAGKKFGKVQPSSIRW